MKDASLHDMRDQARNMRSQILIMALVFAACDDGSPRIVGDNETDDADTDTTSGTDADRDTGAVPNPFTQADCDGIGSDPKRCEYEWCKKKSTYDEDWKTCAIRYDDTCALYFGCYDEFFVCLAEGACPLKTAVPTGADKDRLYACDNTFTDCTLGL